jgi:nucleotide-binding universal stress UspA family protein
VAKAQEIFRHIMVPTDGSQSSVAAGQLAVRLAAANQSKVTFVYVVDPSVVNELANASGKTESQVRRELESKGQRYLNYLLRLATNADLRAEQVIRHGIPYSEIHGLAQEQNVDLIVIGKVGQHGPRRILIGSVTERVIEQAPCPVLVVK